MKVRSKVRSTKRIRHMDGEIAKGTEGYITARGITFDWAVKFKGFAPVMADEDELEERR